jgi:outer membrane protein assembly factor BamB
VTITTGASTTAAGLPGGVPALGNDRPRCSAPDERDGGDWPSLNHDLRNTRQQVDEDRIGTASVGALEPAWWFDAASLAGVGETVTGGMRSTPVVAHGCVYIGLGQGYLGDEGHVVALDIDDGSVVWHRALDASVLGLAVANGLVYATPSKGSRGDVAMPVVTEDYTPAGSHAIAFDAHTGETRWTSERLDDGDATNGTFVNASPVAYEAGGRSLLFVPLAGGGGDGARVPMFFLDALTGATVRKAYSMTDAEYDAGHGGTGIWATAAYDDATQHLYAGTADSDSHTVQHPYNNALLRIDANPSRATFGTVVGAYQGMTEHADLDDYIGSEVNPLCGIEGDGVEVDPPTFFDTSASPTCLELDLDFGGSPNLYEDSRGDLRVGALQKSGIYHSVVASTMSRDTRWTFTVGPGGAFMDGATAAVDAERVLVGATPNLLFGLGRDDGDLRWAGTTDADLFAYQPLTVANGVLYALNDTGILLAFDAATGLPLVRRAIALDGGFQQCLGAGAGIAVARHTVFAPCDAGGPSDLAGVDASPGGLVAYRLPD